MGISPVVLSESITTVCSRSKITAVKYQGHVPPQVFNSSPTGILLAWEEKKQKVHGVGEQEDKQRDKETQGEDRKQEAEHNRKDRQCSLADNPDTTLNLTCSSNSPSTKRNLNQLFLRKPLAPQVCILNEVYLCNWQWFFHSTLASLGTQESWNLQGKSALHASTVFFVLHQPEIFQKTAKHLHVLNIFN